MLGRALLSGVLLGAALIGTAGAQDSGSATGAPDSGRVAGAPFYANTFEKMPAAAALTLLGRQLFSDPALSASGKIACAGCHDPKHAFGPANDLPVQRGGGDGRSFGRKAELRAERDKRVPLENKMGSVWEDPCRWTEARAREWFETVI